MEALGIFFGKVFVWDEGNVHLALTEVDAYGEYKPVSLLLGGAHA